MEVEVPDAKHDERKPDDDATIDDRSTVDIIRDTLISLPASIDLTPLPNPLDPSLSLSFTRSQIGGNPQMLIQDGWAGESYLEWKRHLTLKSGYNLDARHPGDPIVFFSIPQFLENLRKELFRGIAAFAWRGTNDWLYKGTQELAMPLEENEYLRTEVRELVGMMGKRRETMLRVLEAHCKGKNGWGEKALAAWGFKSRTYAGAVHPGGEDDVHRCEVFGVRRGEFEIGRAHV